MKTNKKLEEAFGSIEESGFKTKARSWKDDLHWIEYAQLIALEVLEILDERNITQKMFAEQLGVSAQAVNKWLRGKENFTIETIAKMENTLGIRLLSIGIQPISKQFVTSESFAIKDNYDTSTLHPIGQNEKHVAPVFNMSRNFALTAN